MLIYCLCDYVLIKQRKNGHKKSIATFITLFNYSHFPSFHHILSYIALPVNQFVPVMERTSAIMLVTVFIHYIETFFFRASLPQLLVSHGYAKLHPKTLLTLLVQFFTIKRRKSNFIIYSKQLNFLAFKRVKIFYVESCLIYRPPFGSSDLGTNLRDFVVKERFQH